MTQPLTKYDAACHALAECRTVDEVLQVRDLAERRRLYARQAKDRTLLADATVIQLRAERKLGEMLGEASESGQLARGRPKIKCSEQEQLSRITLKEIGIDRKLSMRSQKTASISERAFEAMVQNMHDKIINGAPLLIDKAAAATEKKQRRANHEQVLGAMQVSLPTRKYGVIMADPEWRFEPWSRETGMDRAAENHYPTSCTEVIAARDVPSIAARDCVLFLWATNPMLPHALLVMAAWGFDYKSNYCWGKDKIGAGYWSREKHELLLIGTKGNIPCPAPGTQRDSLLLEPRGKHSAKPECFLEMIEQYFPTLPKIELNRRGPARPGWSAWGNEAVEHDPETGEISCGVPPATADVAAPAPSVTLARGAGATFS